jgi:hypothetical protein
MEYCPQCGVHNPAGYAVDHAGPNRSNFFVPFLGFGAILVMIAVYLAGPARNKPSDAEATIHTGTVSASLNILENKEFLAKNPKTPEAMRALITSSGYECPRLSNLFLSPETKWEASSRHCAAVGAAAHTRICIIQFIQTGLEWSCANH